MIIIHVISQTMNILPFQSSLYPLGRTQLDSINEFHTIRSKKGLLQYILLLPSQSLSWERWTFSFILLTRLLQLLTSFLRNLPLVSFREIHPPLVSTTRPLSVVFVIRAPPSRWMFRPLTSSLRTELFTDDLKSHRQLASILVIDAVEKTPQ